MQYLGGKSRLRKPICEYLESVRPAGSVFTDVFTGGANIVSGMTGVRVANDACLPLVTMYRHLQRGWAPPLVVTEGQWAAVRDHPDPSDPLTAFVMFGCSYGGKWAGGYARKNNSTYSFAEGSGRSLARKMRTLSQVEFTCADFSDVSSTGLMYCDPPYAGTTQYGYFDGFDHDGFWEQVRQWEDEGARVVVSEYAAPPDFECVFSTDPHGGQLARRSEKLFQLRNPTW